MTQSPSEHFGSSPKKGRARASKSLDLIAAMAAIAEEIEPEAWERCEACQRAEQESLLAAETAERRGKIINMDGSPVEARRTPGITLIPFEQITLDTTQDEWLIKGLVPREGIGVLWGESQTYKSFVEIDKDLHIAFGLQYRGLRTQQGGVVYCAFEGGRGVYKRVEAWRQRFMPEDYAESVPFYLQPMRLNLVKQADALIEAIKRQTDGDGPVKITLDTLNRSLVGSESKDADMGAYLAAADALREAFSCFVSIIHHPGWDAKRIRGHSSLHAGIDLELEATSPGKLLSEIEVLKMKDNDTGLVLASRLEVVKLGVDADGDAISSLVVYPAEAPNREESKARVKLTANQQTMFAILHRAKRLSTAEWYEKAKEAGVGIKRKADLYDIREKLKDLGLVTQIGDQWSVKHESKP